MQSLQTADWDELKRLAQATGFSEERVIVVQHQAKPRERTFAGSATLLIGQPHGGLDLLLSRWLGAGAVAAIGNADNRPVVIGHRPDMAQPRSSNWPVFKMDQMLDGYLYALEVSTISTSLISSFADFGGFDQAIFVTRWAQPLSESERRIVPELVKLTDYIRGLVIALPGEQPTPDETIEVRQFVEAHLQRSGFAGSRTLGVDFWETGGKRINDGFISSPADLLAVPPAIRQLARHGHERRLVADLVTQICARSNQSQSKPVLPLTADEHTRIVAELEKHLTTLKRGIEKQMAGELRDTPRLRADVLDQLHEWRNKSTLHGIWLHHLEAVRPGAQEGLFAKAGEAVQQLELSLAPASTTLKCAFPPTDAKWVATAKRIGVALVTGTIAYALVVALCPPVFQAYSILSNAGLMIGAIIGYSWISPKLISTRHTTDSGSGHRDVDIYLHNWNSFERELHSWLQAHLSNEPASVTARCRAFANRLDIPLLERSSAQL